MPIKDNLQMKSFRSRSPKYTIRSRCSKYVYAKGTHITNKNKFLNYHLWNSMCSQYTCIVSFLLHSR